MQRLSKIQTPVQGTIRRLIDKNWKAITHKTEPDSATGLLIMFKMLVLNRGRTTSVNHTGWITQKTQKSSMIIIKTSDDVLT